MEPDAIPHLNFSKAFWITADTPAQLDQFINHRSIAIAYDKENRPVYFQKTNG